jgi:hypothetical protein
VPDRQKASAAAFHILAAPLILITPFASFIGYNGYSYLNPEVALVVGMLVAVGLVCGLAMLFGGWPIRALALASLTTLFIDFQFDWFKEFGKFTVIAVFGGVLLTSCVLRTHITRIVSIVFGTMFLMTVVLPAGQVASESVPQRMSGDPSLPRIVHLILDAHIGIEGIPTDIEQGEPTKRDLKKFYEKHGFRLFERAYSRYLRSYNSISNLLNFSSAEIDGQFVTEREPYLLERNEYFRELGEAGYAIHVYQLDFMDFCQGNEQYIASCETYASADLSWLESEPRIPLLVKVRLILATYVRRSHLLNRGIVREHARIGLIPVMPVFDAIARDTAASAPGDMFFAHLATPHTPYVYRSDCSLKPPADWEHRMDVPPLPQNTLETRARRYPAYLEQVRCTTQKLSALFELWEERGIFEDMIIIIHGDHGSKIFLNYLGAKNYERAPERDFVDAFSILFAVKAPDLDPGYDLRIESAENLLREAISADGSKEIDREPYVFLYAGKGEPMLKHPLVEPKSAP